MEEKKGVMEYLRRIATADLWAELGRRFNVKYGRLQMAFHAGRPSEFADLDMRVAIAEAGSVRVREIGTQR